MFSFLQKMTLQLANASLQNWLAIICVGLLTYFLYILGTYLTKVKGYIAFQVHFFSQKQVPFAEKSRQKDHSRDSSPIESAEGCPEKESHREWGSNHKGEGKHPVLGHWLLKRTTEDRKIEASPCPQGLPSTQHIVILVFNIFDTSSLTGQGCGGYFSAQLCLWLYR